MDRLQSAITLLTPAMVASTRLGIQRLARDAVPALADFCLVYVAIGSTIRCVAAAHATSDGTRLLRALVRGYRVRRRDGASTVAHVIRSARPLLRTDIAPETDVERRTGSHAAIANLHRRLAIRSALAVPVRVGASVLGAVSLCYSHSGRSYAARDIPAATRLATRIARVLTRSLAPDATLGLRTAARHARQGTTLRRRMAARN